MTNREKREARRHASIMLFQYDLSKSSPEEVIKAYWESERAGIEVIEMANTIFRGTVRQLENVDREISKHLKHNWRISRLFPMDRAILRTAVYEMLNENFSPPPAIINDAVEIAKAYGGDEKSPNLVNAILDRIFKELKR